MNRTAIAVQEASAERHAQRIARASSSIDNRVSKASSSSRTKKRSVIGPTAYNRPGSAAGRSSRPGSALSGGRRSFTSNGHYDSEEEEEEVEDETEALTGGAHEAPALSSEVTGYCRPSDRPCTAPLAREQGYFSGYVPSDENIMEDEEEGIMQDDGDEDEDEQISEATGFFRGLTLEETTPPKGTKPPLPAGRPAGAPILERKLPSHSPPRELLNCNVGPMAHLNGEESSITAPVERNVYRPRPRSAPMSRPDSATSASGKRERPLSAPKWGERPPSGLDGRPSSERRAPISTESLRALAGLTDDLLGIVNDEGDEHNPDDLDLVESPRLEGLDEAEEEYNKQAGKSVRHLEEEESIALDEDDYSSEEETEYNFRSLDVAMSRAADAPRDAARLRLGVHSQNIIHEDYCMDEAPPAPMAPAPMDRFTAGVNSRPKSAVVQRPRSGVSRKASGKTTSKTNGGAKKGDQSRVSFYAEQSGSVRERPMSGKVRGGRSKHNDLVAAALAKDPKKLSRGMGCLDYRPTSASSELYLGTLRAES